MVAGAGEVGRRAERGDQLIERSWSRVRCWWERQVAKRAAAADDGVGAELMDVLGRPTESATGATSRRYIRIVPGDHTRRQRSSSCSQQFVQDPISVSDDVEREPKAGPVGGRKRSVVANVTAAIRASPNWSR